MELVLQNNAPDGSKTDWHLWAVGALTLIWSLYGVARFMGIQVGWLDPSAIAAASPEFALFVQLPLWATAFWAVNVWGLLVGSVLLLVQSRWAVQGFFVAIFGLIGVSAQLFIFADQPADIYSMPIALATWIITTLALLYVSRIQTQSLLH